MSYREYSCEAVISNLDEVMAFIEDCLTEHGCPLKRQIQINVAVDEIFANVVHYAYGKGTGPVTLRFEPLENPAGAKITVIDSGIPFNPLARKDPDLSGTSEERKIGGLGIFMVKKSMDSVDYEYSGGCNRFSITKYFD